MRMVANQQTIIHFSNRHTETGFFVHSGIISTVKRVVFISDGISYITLGGR
jgi:hypothetical protein